MSARLLFPVGHYLGPVYEAEEPVEVCHRLRIGSAIVNLLDPAEATVWQLAHGRPNDAQRPTTDSVVTEAMRLGYDDAAAALARLRADGAVVPVTTGTVDAIRFARTHRLVGLMVSGPVPVAAEQSGALGARKGRAGAAIGPIGRPAVWTPAALFEAWRWGSCMRNLWDLTALLAEGAWLADRRPREVEDLLTGLLGGLHSLLAVHAAHVDIADPSPIALNPVMVENQQTT